MINKVLEWFSSRAANKLREKFEKKIPQIYSIGVLTWDDEKSSKEIIEIISARLQEHKIARLAIQEYIDAHPELNEQVSVAWLEQRKQVFSKLQPKVQTLQSKCNLMGQLADAQARLHELLKRELSSREFQDIQNVSAHYKKNANQLLINFADFYKKIDAPQDHPNEDIFDEIIAILKYDIPNYKQKLNEYLSSLKKYIGDAEAALQRADAYDAIEASKKIGSAIYERNLEEISPELIDEFNKRKSKAIAAAAEIAEIINLMPPDSRQATEEYCQSRLKYEKKFEIQELNFIAKKQAGKLYILKGYDQNDQGLIEKGGQLYTKHSGELSLFSQTIKTLVHGVSCTLQNDEGSWLGKTRYFISPSDYVERIAGILNNGLRASDRKDSQFSDDELHSLKEIFFYDYDRIQVTGYGLVSILFKPDKKYAIFGNHPLAREERLIVTKEPIKEPFSVVINTNYNRTLSVLSLGHGGKSVQMSIYCAEVKQLLIERNIAFTEI